MGPSPSPLQALNPGPKSPSTTREGYQHKASPRPGLSQHLSLREGAGLKTGAEKVSGNTHPPMHGTGWQRCGGSIRTPEPPTSGRLPGLL